MTKREVLSNTTFGERIAEDEAEALSQYFVQTEEWRRVIAGEVDIVYGPKGAGKSALYALLRDSREDLFKRGIILASGEKIRGAPVFQDLVIDPPASEEQFKGLWKVYFLTLIGTALKITKFDNPSARELFRALEDNGLLSPEWSLRRMFKLAQDYMKRIEGVEGTVNLSPTTGTAEGVGAKVLLREPQSAQRKLGFVSVDDLFELSDKALETEGNTFWIVMDRLDVAFAETSELEANAIRALFRVYRDLAELKHLSVKIFLRDDIWVRITAAGFREASHITKAINIKWDSRSLLHLVIRRALYNKLLCDFYKVDPALILASTEEQERLFYRIFPKQVDPGARKSITLDWLLSRTADGTGNTAPRELIHLLSEARNQQLKFLEMGAGEPPDEALFDRTSLKAALPAVSKVRFQQTMEAEHPAFKPLFAKLEGEKTQQTPETLAKIWGVGVQQALANAEKLSEVGFFEKRGTKEQPQFWVPFLYRDALKLVQGSAE